jgi:hypothetical protein
MSTRATSQLFAGVQLDDYEEFEEVIPPTGRRPIVASDGTSGSSSHVFSTPKSQATSQVGHD